MRYPGVDKFLWLLRSGGLPALLAWLVLVVLVAGFNIESYRLTGGDIAVAVLAFAAGFAFMKVTGLLIFYPLVYRSKFDGPLFVVLALNCMLLLVALSATAYLGRSSADSPSASDICFMLVGSYTLTLLILWAVIPIMHGMLRFPGRRR